MIDAVVVDLDDARMPQLRQRVVLAHEVDDLVAREQALQCDSSTGTAVMRCEHLAHAAARQSLPKLVAASYQLLLLLLPRLAN